MRILQVNTADSGGGAEGSARNLLRIYRERGHASWLAVGEKRSEDPDIFEIPRVALAGPGRIVQWFAECLRRRRPGSARMHSLARRLEVLADPKRRRDRRLGREDFNFPGSDSLLSLPPRTPDLIHCHNLHGGYFNLACLPALSRRVPLILNLRDAWLLTGHCAYFMDCERWRTGCGGCPDLARYPGIRRDATAANWRRKADILAQCRLYVTAPSQCLLDWARSSVLEAAEFRMIPNGIDLSVFHPGNRAAARHRLNLPAERPIVLFAAASPHNVYKDPRTMVEAIRRLTESDARALFLCLGRKPPKALLRSGRIRHVPFQREPGRVADYYRAADVFVHTARAEAFGKTVTESMACGTPVVATNVGGIPEQFSDGEAGFLTPLGDAEAIAARTRLLLDDAELRVRLAGQAAQAGARYSLDVQADSFLEWYAWILAEYADGSGGSTVVHAAGVETR